MSSGTLEDIKYHYGTYIFTVVIFLVLCIINMVQSVFVLSARTNIIKFTRNFYILYIFMYFIYLFILQCLINTHPLLFNFASISFSIESRRLRSSCNFVTVSKSGHRFSSRHVEKNVQHIYFFLYNWQLLAKEATGNLTLLCHITKI